jgi:DNA polymerase-3 subunit gamma/tau
VGHVPDSLPVTEETRDRLREQANQLPEPTVVRLFDLLAVAVDDARKGGDPRLPLELALVKVTRPHADLSRESLAHRVEVLEERLHAGPSAVSRAPSPVPAPAAGPAPAASTANPAPGEPAEEERSNGGSDDVGPGMALDQLQDAWTRSVLPAIRERSIPVATLLGEAHPVALEGDTLTLEFAPAADFHRRQVEEQRNVALLSEALREVTGRKLAVQTTVGAAAATQTTDAEPMSEEDVISLLKDTFDATEVEESP